MSTPKWIMNISVINIFGKLVYKICGYGMVVR